MPRPRNWRDIVVEIEPSDPVAFRQWHAQKRRERWGKRIGWALALLLVIVLIQWLHGLGSVPVECGIVR
ncbi:hypothetical protein GCM10011371_33530 [Novosphingobium marinum]|uniref:Uncharacterized protein n=1 Tax=Novosphingobium marinum TaxID=1514948 RepID=A0A7Y9XYQ2_9SPHN|nr:hypothetical protein [Novosphingobium marinum]GGC43376.1 hypothetical protein GCM10011371_33530 [Novosphingobium marinum]